MCYYLIEFDANRNELKRQRVYPHKRNVNWIDNVFKNVKPCEGGYGAALYKVKNNGARCLIELKYR